MHAELYAIGINRSLQRSGYFRVTVFSSNVNDIETKAQTFRHRSFLSEQNQNVLLRSAYYRNESRTFQSVPKRKLPILKKRWVDIANLHTGIGSEMGSAVS